MERRKRVMVARPSNREKLDTPEKKAIVKVVKSLLKARKRTYEDLANHIGISVTSVNRFMNHKQWLSFENLLAAAEYLQVPLSEFFRYAEGGKAVPLEVFSVEREKVEEFKKKRGISDNRFKGWMQGLDTTERVVIKKRLFMTPEASLSELGRLLGVTKERVRQIHDSALSKL